MTDQLIDFFLLMKSELLLLAVIFIMLFMNITAKENADGTPVDNNHSILVTANILLLLNFLAGFFMNTSGNLFGDTFTSTELTAFQKNILNLGTLLVSLQSYNWLKTHKHVMEFYMLMLATLLGMFLMISSQHMLLFYLGLELSTIPLAALVNFDLEKKKSAEAAMKMIMMSAFSSALLLFGISLFYGTMGTLHFQEIPAALNGSDLQLYCLILLIAAFGFKISAVPFHFWTADVYEGAPVPVTSYLSVISKGSILFVMTTVLYNVFAGMGVEWYLIICVLAVATMITGNIFAVRQQNLKRLLAFSSIAQVGFILVGMSGQNTEGAVSVTYFIIIYIFSNLGALGVISVVSALTGKEKISDYKGFYKTNPMLSWILAIALFSLAGIPPTSGFFGKFFLLLAGAGNGNYTLVIIAALNMIVSLYYYLKIVKAVFMDANEEPIPTINLAFLPKAGLLICLIGIIVTGLASGSYNYIQELFASL